MAERDKATERDAIDEKAEAIEAEEARKAAAAHNPPADGERSTDAVMDTGPVATQDPVDIDDELPIDIDELDDPATGEQLPAAEDPEAHDPTDVDTGDFDIDVGGLDEDHGNATDVMDHDPGDFADELEEFLAEDQAYGGLDGRNPTDSGGGKTSPVDPADGFDPDVSNPIGGIDPSLDGAAGKLSERDQATVDALKDKIFALSQEDPSKENAKQAEALAAQVQSIVNPNATSGAEVPEKATSAGATPVPIHEGEDGIRNTKGNEELAEEYEGGTLEWIADLISGSGTDDTRSQTLNQIESELKDLEGSNEDRIEDDEGPSMPGLDDFIDQYNDIQLEARLGADITPTPDDTGGGPATGSVDDDPTDFVAQYEQGHYSPTEEDLIEAAADLPITPDEEFFET